MDRNEFLNRADACLQRVEAWLEDFDPDELDFDPADGVVKLQFPDGTTFVLNRQTAAGQMWYAAGARAWHYDWDPETESWRDDKEGGELYERIGTSVSDKLARQVAVS